MVAFTVNGKWRAIDVPPETPLLWVIRDYLKLPGTKFGCGAGLCGACTVHVEGKPVRACVTEVQEAALKSVKTIEGLSPDASHPLQKALARRASAAMRLLPTGPRSCRRRRCWSVTRNPAANRSLNI